MGIELTQINIKKLTQEIADAARQSSTKEDFKIRAEHVLRKDACGYPRVRRRA